MEPILGVRNLCRNPARPGLWGEGGNLLAYPVRNA
jgi:hypothetical protein